MKNIWKIVGILVGVVVLAYLFMRGGSDSTDTGLEGEGGGTGTTGTGYGCFSPEPQFERWDENNTDWAGSSWIVKNSDWVNDDNITYVLAWMKLVGIQTKEVYFKRYESKIKAYVESPERLPHWEVIANSKRCSENIPGDTAFMVQQNLNTLQINERNRIANNNFIYNHPYFNR